MVLRAVEMFRGHSERSEASEVVGQVQVQARIEARDPEGVVVFPGTLVGEGIGSVEGADIPDQGLGGIVVQVGEIVRERAAMERVARRTDPLPQGQQVTPGRLGVAVAAAEDRCADRVHRGIGCRGGGGHETPVEVFGECGGAVSENAVSGGHCAA